jgi:hypothetical protein
LSGCVDLCGDGGEGVPSPIGVVVGDCLLQALAVGRDELGQLDEQRDVQRRQVEQLFSELVEVVVA